MFKNMFLLQDLNILNMLISIFFPRSCILTHSPLHMGKVSPSPCGYLIISGFVLFCLHHSLNYMLSPFCSFHKENIKWMKKNVMTLVIMLLFVPKFYCFSQISNTNCPSYPLGIWWFRKWNIIQYVNFMHILPR